MNSSDSLNHSCGDHLLNVEILSDGDVICSDCGEILIASKATIAGFAKSAKECDRSFNKQVKTVLSD